MMKEFSNDAMMLFWNEEAVQFVRVEPLIATRTEQDEA
jgi:hypothetical protein